MTASKFVALPCDIHPTIIRYLPMQDLMQMYQLSRYWKYIISNDKFIWRSIYEHKFGHEFAKDRWILWAVRRIWSQALSEEKRLEARHVQLNTLEHLDGYTWYCLVRGRLLTEKNWRNNTPQRSVIFSGVHFDEHVWDAAATHARVSYGLAFTTSYDRLGFAIIDDTLHNVPSMPMSSTPANSLVNKSVMPSVVDGKVVLLDPMLDTTTFAHNLSSEEFIIAEKIIIEGDLDARMVTQLILSWNIGQLETHSFGNRLYCTPRLCMAELLPSHNYSLVLQQGGWLLIRDIRRYTDIHTQHECRQYILYDVRRGRVAASFSVRGDVRPIIGKVTQDSVQLYYGYTTPITNAAASATSKTELYQYHWRIIEISVPPDTQALNADLSQYQQPLASNVMRKVTEKYHAIEECVKKHGHWCDDSYLLKTTAAKGGIQLEECMEPDVQERHLIDDLFLISRKGPFGSNLILVHSVQQQRVIWSKAALRCITLIPEEKAILTYTPANIAQLLDMYTGDILNQFKIQCTGDIRHIIGSLCCTSDDILIDVRTGKKIRELVPNQITRATSSPYVQDIMESHCMLEYSAPTGVGYIGQDNLTLWIDEYAQV